MNIVNKAYNHHFEIFEEFKSFNMMMTLTLKERIMHLYNLQSGFQSTLYEPGISRICENMNKLSTLRAKIKERMNTIHIKHFRRKGSFLRKHENQEMTEPS